MKLKSLIITSALLLAACGYTQAQSTQVIAHRGFWKTDGSAQNSIAALVKADSINCYGSEFDVWLTADNQLVVNHDSTFKGVNMQKSTAQQCTAVILDNGEQLPTLRQYLEKAGQLKTRLILELKSHKTPEQETRAVESIVKMVKDMGLENRMEYIAFSRHATKEFIRLTPKGTPVYYLEGESVRDEHRTQIDELMTELNDVKELYYNRLKIEEVQDEEIERLTRTNKKRVKVAELRWLLDGHTDVLDEHRTAILQVREAVDQNKETLSAAQREMLATLDRHDGLISKAFACIDNHSDSIYKQQQSIDALLSAIENQPKTKDDLWTYIRRQMNQQGVGGNNEEEEAR